MLTAATSRSTTRARPVRRARGQRRSCGPSCAAAFCRWCRRSCTRSGGAGGATSKTSSRYRYEWS